MQQSNRTRRTRFHSLLGWLMGTRRRNHDPPDDTPDGICAETFQLGSAEFVLFEMPLEFVPPAAFTPAEREVLNHVRAGLSSAEIARARGTSARTVANQLASMYRKMGVNSRQELIATLLRGDAD